MPTIKPPLPTRTLQAARRLRESSTEAEHKLWQRLRGGRIQGQKFRRQHPLPPYVADFYCDAAKLVIEVDGSQHNADTDRDRTAALERRGVCVLRFWDNDVLLNTESVLEAILETVASRTLAPNPPSRGEGT